MSDQTHPIFWRDSTLAHAELRYIEDGHRVRYTPHSHPQWSIGCILEGQSSFLCGERLHQVSKGDLVIMNAQEVHACNPAQDSPWSYYMLHLDCDWLGKLLHQAGLQLTDTWQATGPDVLRQSTYFQSLCDLCNTLLSDSPNKTKEEALKAALLELFQHELNGEQAITVAIPNNVSQVAYYLIEHADQDDAITAVADKFGFSSSYLTRQFKRYYHMTPHAFRLDRRIQLGQIALKNGVPIAEVAGQFGFSDQAHFQRVFKQRVAATPRQYSTPHPTV